MGEKKMSIYESQYRKLDKKPKHPPFFWKASRIMSSFEIRRGLFGNWAKVPIILAGFIIFGFMVFLDQIVGANKVNFWNSVQSNISRLLAPIDGPGGLISLQVAIVSGGLIASDLKDRAIDLYFSKIRLREYFAAKFWASCALAFIGLPLFTLIYFVVAFYKRWPALAEYSTAFAVLEKTIFFIVIEVSFFAMLVLLFSAYSSSSVNSGLSFFIFLLVTRVLFETILYRATNLEILFALSPLTALNEISKDIFLTNPHLQVNIVWDIVSYLFYFIISFVLILLKLKKEQNK